MVGTRSSAAKKSGAPSPVPELPSRRTRGGAAKKAPPKAKGKTKQSKESSSEDDDDNEVSSSSDIEINEESSSDEDDEQSPSNPKSKSSSKAKAKPKAKGKKGTSTTSSDSDTSSTSKEDKKEPSTTTTSPSTSTSSSLTSLSSPAAPSSSDSASTSPSPAPVKLSNAPPSSSEVKAPKAAPAKGASPALTPSEPKKEAPKSALPPPVSSGPAKSSAKSSPPSSNGSDSKRQSSPSTNTGNGAKPKTKANNEVKSIASLAINDNDDDNANVGTSSDFPADMDENDDIEGDSDEDDEEDVNEGDDESSGLDDSEDDSDDESKKPKKAPGKKAPAKSSSSTSSATPPTKQNLLSSSSSSSSSSSTPQKGSVSDDSSATSRIGYRLTELDLGPVVEEKKKEGETPEERAARRERNAKLRKAHGKKFLPADQRKGDDENLAELSDSSDEEGGMLNRIGGVPLEWYDNYDHIGYDVHGKRVVKPAGGDALDRLMDRIDNPNFGRTVNDPLNAKQVVLTDEELQMINRIRKGRAPHASSEQYPDYVDWFTSQKEVEALGNPQEPKARFIPSKHEARLVAKLVNAMLNGWVKMPSQREEEERQQRMDDDRGYLMWADDGHAIDGGPGRSKPPSSIPPPKPPLPGHNESYNPPAEYLPTQDEIDKYDTMDPSERPQFLSKGHNALREVGRYDDYVKERFERCLDLYLCPRIKRTPKRIDPDSLIPNLPKPSELKPFPQQLSIEFRGHTHRIRTISVSPDGQWLVSGSDDATVRVWEVSTGRCFRRWDLKHVGEVIDCVAWNPNPNYPLVAAAVGTRVMLLHTMTGTEEQESMLESLFTAPPPEVSTLGDADEAGTKSDKQARAAAAVKRNVSWGVNNKVDTLTSTDPNPLPLEDPLAAAPPPTAPEGKGDSKDKKAKRKATIEATSDGQSEIKWSRIAVETGKRVKQVVWHPKGDYFATFSPESSATSILIHRLSRNQTQTPFSKSKGLVQSVLFHPTKPFFFVASQTNIRVYNLAQEQLVKKLTSPAKWISSMSIHPSGDHLLIGSYDRKICWYDLDYGSAPYKSLKYHKKAVRSVCYHPRYPLFASSSDDGKLHIFHGMVYSDLLTPPMIVPVKILHAHIPVNDLGAMNCTFHPTQPWIFSSGADHVIRLFV